MVQLLRSSIVAGALVFAMARTPAFAEDSNLGPVGPNEPILASFGGQRVIAFFVPERGACSVHAFMWKEQGPDAPYATSRVRMNLRPGEMARFDNAHLSMNLLCGADASTLAVVAPPEPLTQNETNN